MTDVLLARGGFRDDTALLHLHHAADLTVRTVEASLDGVHDGDLAPHARSAPACLVFCSSEGGLLLDDVVLDALEERRARHPELAFLAVIDTDAGTVAERAHAAVRLLEAGADDVVSFRLHPLELSARVTACVRRVQRRRQPRGMGAGRSGAALSLAAPVTATPAAASSGGGAVYIDARRRELVGPAGRVALTAKEAALLDLLLASEEVVGRERLGQILWTGPWRGTAKAIDMHVANLRRKLPTACGDAVRIETVRGAGFIVTQDAERGWSVTG